MKRATKGKWAGFHPATNCLWLHYLADTLLTQKAFPMSPAQKKALRDFRCCLMRLVVPGVALLKFTGGIVCCCLCKIVHNGHFAIHNGLFTCISG